MDIRCRSDRREIHTADVNAHFTISVFCADFEHAWQFEAVQECSGLMEEGKKLKSGLVRRRGAPRAWLLASCIVQDPGRGRRHHQPRYVVLASTSNVYIQPHSSWHRPVQALVLYHTYSHLRSCPQLCSAPTLLSNRLATLLILGNEHLGS